MIMTYGAWDLWSLGLMELGTYGRNSGSVLASPAVTIVSIQSWACISQRALQCIFVRVHQ